VLRAEEIASSSRRVAGIVIGGSDLAETTRSRHTPDRIPQVTALSLCILAARAYGLAIIDAVHPNLRDEAGFAESCERGVELGFDGKSAVLPATLAIANRVFGPSEEEIAHAREQVAAAGGASDGYASLHLIHARRVVARAEKIAARTRR
jgi:citrate lyase subunit beta/citryl-CoA lyase